MNKHKFVCSDLYFIPSQLAISVRTHTPFTFVCTRCDSQVKSVYSYPTQMEMTGQKINPNCDDEITKFILES